jgi:hypothetical protein
MTLALLNYLKGGNKGDTRSLGDFLKINTAANSEAKKYEEFAKKVRRGEGFGNAEVQRAIQAGYTMDDVNGYLKWTGLTPKGDFAVGGYNVEDTTGFGPSGTKDSRLASDSSRSEYYRFVGPQPSTAPAQQPSSSNISTPTPTATQSTSPLNPELAISPNDMNFGDSIRVTGENLGIKAKRSRAQISRSTSKGTSRLTIPRSSGASSLNMGL